MNNPIRSPRHTRPTKGVLYVRTIPSAVKSLFKGVCARRGDDMGTVIASLMQLYIKDPNCVKVPKKK